MISKRSMLKIPGLYFSPSPALVLPLTSTMRHLRTQKIGPMWSRWDRNWPVNEACPGAVTNTHAWLHTQCSSPELWRLKQLVWAAYCSFVWLAAFLPPTTRGQCDTALMPGALHASVYEISFVLSQAEVDDWWPHSPKKCLSLSTLVNEKCATANKRS